jgi:hypothetical protein
MRLSPFPWINGIASRGWEGLLVVLLDKYNILSPNIRTPGRGFTPEFTPLLYNKCGGEPGVKPGAWRPEMLALEIAASYFILILESSSFLFKNLMPGSSCGILTSARAAHSQGLAGEYK